MHTINGFFWALLLISLFLFVAHILKRIFVRRIFIPTSLIAGFLALLLGPEVLGAIMTEDNSVSFLPKGLQQQEIINIWKELPEYLIIIVFAGLFLGKKIPHFKKIIKRSMPNLCFGYTLALGQYIIGLLTAMFILKPLFNTDVVAGALIAIGFQGGHGTVAGLKNSFSAVNFNDGLDLGIGIATIGLISAIIFGAIMSNINGEHNSNDSQSSDSEDQDNLEEIKKGSLTQQIAIVGITVFIGWMILKGFALVEMLIFSTEESKVMKFIPLFPVAMLAGLIVQVLVEKLRLAHYISRKHITFITNISLDFLIVAAIGSLSLTTIGNNIAPLLILGGCGVAYNVLIYFLMGKIFFKQSWRHRALGEFGQSTGTTAIGLILIRNSEKNAGKYTSAFSYKQPLYEPIVGGGLLTGIAIPLIKSVGPYVFVVGITGLLAVILLLYFIFYKNSGA